MVQLSLVNFRRGSYLTVEGMPNSGRFFIIQTGNVSCYKTNDTSGEGMRVFNPGDFVGIMSCMSGHSEIETSIALNEVTAIAVRRDQYPDLIRDNTPVALKIIRVFANRMRAMNEQLTRLTLTSVAIDTPEHIYEVADHYFQTKQFNIAAYAYYQYLKTHSVSANMDDAKRKFVALKSKARVPYYEPTPDLTRSYPKDTMIFSESQSGAEMFIIQDGQVKISKVADGDEVTLSMLQKGDMFGEMALIENKPRSASAIAHTDCVLMAVNRQNFNQMVATQPQLISRLTTTLANRIWSMYRKFDNANIPDPLHKMIDMLAIYLEKNVGVIQPKMQFQTDLTLVDLANMCGIPLAVQESVIDQLRADSGIEIMSDKIFALDCMEIVKRAASYRKQNELMQEKMKKAIGR